MKNGAKIKKTGSIKSVKRKWRLFSVMIVYVGAGRLFVFFFPVKVVRGSGSVGNPRIGGQSFLLSLFLENKRCMENKVGA